MNTKRGNTNLADIRLDLIRLESDGFTDVKLDITTIKEYVPYSAWRRKQGIKDAKK